MALADYKDTKFPSISTKQARILLKHMTGKTLPLPIYIDTMEIKSHFDHLNINVTDLQRSLDFYKRALGFEKTGEIVNPDGSFIINYVSRPGENFCLELTWLRDHPQPYELGDNESHLAVRVEGDYDAIREYHRHMGCICFENHEMNLYFIHDPDDYWIEVLPYNR